MARLLLASCWGLLRCNSNVNRDIEKKCQLVPDSLETSMDDLLLSSKLLDHRQGLRTVGLQLWLECLQPKLPIWAGIATDLPHGLLAILLNIVRTIHLKSGRPDMGL